MLAALASRLEFYETEFREMMELQFFTCKDTS